MRTGLILAVAALFAGAAVAHIGSPDVFFEGRAGSYPLLVTIRPPNAVPGVARVEIRALSPGIQSIELTPTPMTGAAATHPPVADVAQRSSTDPSYFEGSLWLMTTGSWKIRVRVTGGLGSGELQVPVSSLALKIRPMQTGVSWFLLGMMVFLTAGMVAIVGAAVREAQVDPAVAAPGWNRKAIAAMVCASVVLVFALWQGKLWWGENAVSSEHKLYKPLSLSAVLDAPAHLQLKITDPGWLALRRLDDLIPDHDHLMHLFLVRWPDMDYIFHLHPDQLGTGYFGISLPSLPSGDWRIYGDIVHENGLAETAAGSVALPDVKGKPLAGDDAGGPATSDLANGYRMVWLNRTHPVLPNKPTLFTFEIVGTDEKPATDLEPYMGMGGHAEFIKYDGSVFAHIHPTGTVPMASMAVASPAGMLAMHETKIGPEVSFPYGPPSSGRYRIFVQLKRAGKVETGAFDIDVSPPA
jgi:hypothetical protein